MRPADREVGQLVLLVREGGEVTLHPAGDRAAVERALRSIVELLHARPELVKCAAGTCGECSAS